MMQLIAHGEELIWNYLKKVVAVNRDFIGEEAGEVKTLLNLITDRWNTGKKWTQGELKEFRTHLRNSLKIVYALIIFLLPGGLVLIPFVAGWFHRPRG